MAPVTLAPPSDESCMASKMRRMRGSLSENTCRSPTLAAVPRHNGPRAMLKRKHSPLTSVRGPNNSRARRLRSRANSLLLPELLGTLASLNPRATTAGSSRPLMATARTDAVP